MFVAGWRHALWSEWPFIIIISSRSSSQDVNNAFVRLTGVLCLCVCVCVVLGFWGCLE